MDSTLFTIGHSTRTINAFILLLQKYNISYLIDVRSVPFSQYNPQYNKNELSTALRMFNIKYVFMGDELGGRPKEAYAYDEAGHAVYKEFKNILTYKLALKRLVDASNIKENVAIMCSELNPQDCHRSKAISEDLCELGVSSEHIDKSGNLISHEALVLAMGESVKRSKKPIRAVKVKEEIGDE
jgi:uncharacterized protein (DUF488 family)